MILNIGSGGMEYGDIRIDIYRAKAVDVIASAESLPFRNESFDIVFSRCVFEHLPNALDSLLEQKRVCKVGGRIEIITDNAGYWAYHILGHHTKPLILIGKRRLYEGKAGSDKHYALYTREHLENLFSLAGIVPIKVEFSDFGTEADFINKIVRAFRVLVNFSYPRIHAVGLKTK
jgi:ubiquinone/menaquinone biosynthesis C-methylase UbiE